MPASKGGLPFPLGSTSLIHANADNSELSGREPVLGQWAEMPQVSRSPTTP
jgi:hypothetical protein